MLRQRAGRQSWYAQARLLVLDRRSEPSLSRIAYVNGRYLPRGEAAVHIEDRGYQFSDGVYEVCEVRDGRIIDERRHMARLERSLDELRIKKPMSQSALGRGPARMRTPQPCARRHRLSAGHARGGAPRSRLPAAGHAAERRGDRPQHRFCRQRAQPPPRASRSSPCPTTAGSGSISSRSRSCPMCWRRRPPASAMPRRPGSWTVTAMSPKGHRAMPGSSPWMERW